MFVLCANHVMSRPDCDTGEIRASASRYRIVAGLVADSPEAHVAPRTTRVSAYALSDGIRT